MHACNKGKTVPTKYKFKEFVIIIKENAKKMLKLRSRSKYMGKMNYKRKENTYIIYKKYLFILLKGTVYENSIN